MRITKLSIHLSDAQQIAEQVKAELAPACQRVEIAGSIRRQKETVGDIEIVCIPVPVLDMFGEPAGDTELDYLLHRLVNLVNRQLEPPTKNGTRYKQFELTNYHGLKLDLFIANPDNWGIIYAIRTGSAEFARKLVTQRNRGGLLPSDCRVAGGYIWRGEEQLQTPSEREVLEMCGGWVEPVDRR